MEHTIKTLLGQGKSQRRIAQDLGISRKVVRRIKKQLDDQLPSKGYERAKQLEAYASQIDTYVEQDWSAVLIHQKLREKHGLQVSYATVRCFTAERKGQEVFVPMSCAAGEEGQVDFGYVGRFVQGDGREVKVWVFCMVLSHSRYGYYEVVTDREWRHFCAAIFMLLSISEGCRIGCCWII